MAVLSLSNLKKTWYYFQKNGVKAAYLAALERLEEGRRTPYHYEAPDEEECNRQRRNPAGETRFSIAVPAYETRKEHLFALLDSLAAQTYPHWELVLADAGHTDSVHQNLKEWAAARKVAVIWDAGQTEAAEWQDRSIRYHRLSENAGIAGNTNVAIEMAAGDYIGLLDHDDWLTPDALYEMAAAIENGKKQGAAPGVLYSDEDKCDGTGTEFYEPHHKMDFNFDLLLTNNYICHFLVMESSLMKQLKLRDEYNGAQDFDLVLRAAAQGKPFVHVPRVLYHWRCHNDSTAANPQSKTYAYEAGKRAVEDFCRQAGWQVCVSHLQHLGFYRVDYEQGVFAQRMDVGAVAGPLPAKKYLESGIYQTDGQMLFKGLRRGFSGPMHRAALQQDADCADLRSMRVCPALQEEYEAACAQLEKNREAVQSAAFCTKLRAAGYRILWDPCAVKEYKEQ